MLNEIKKDFEWGIKAGGKGQGYTNLDDEQIEWLIKTIEKMDNSLHDIQIIASTMEDSKHVNEIFYIADKAQLD